MLPLASASDASSPHEQQFRRQAVVAVVAIALVTSIFALAVGFPLNWTRGVQLGLALLVLKNAALLLWLRAFPQHYTLAGGLHFLTLAGVGLYRVEQAVLVEHMTSGLSLYSYWLPLSYVVAFLAFRRRWALAASLGLFLVLLSVVVVFVVAVPDVPAIKREHSVLLVQMLLTHATFISFFVLFGVLQNRYVRTISEAQSEARAAYVDALTGVANRRQLGQWLAGRLEHRAGQNEPLSIILLDLDRFKSINDTYGHDIGDQVLRAAAEAVGASLRRGTLFGRWGGEEFLVILPGAALAEAQGVAERIRLGVASATYPLPVQVTVSLGVAQAREGERPEGILKRADQALYTAKHAGRNQVQAA
ncbi:sensor domain-containing diguanylate cyclase [Deinococcus navajonensis]|uniref:Diguanylate cyclase n=1 Tax=Deinococcus navajonensis TaxID=309884 RepID=A0ABV8XLN0_9DEIO